jgi:hypothetical protein
MSWQVSGYLFEQGRVRRESKGMQAKVKRRIAPNQIVDEMKRSTFGFQAVEEPRNPSQSRCGGIAQPP